MASLTGARWRSQTPTTLVSTLNGAPQLTYNSTCRPRPMACPRSRATARFVSHSTMYFECVPIALDTTRLSACEAVCTRAGHLAHSRLFPTVLHRLHATALNDTPLRVPHSARIRAHTLCIRLHSTEPPLALNRVPLHAICAQRRDIARTPRDAACVQQRISICAQPPAAARVQRCASAIVPLVCRSLLLVIDTPFLLAKFMPTAPRHRMVSPHRTTSKMLQYQWRRLCR
jgi:hypothetical protein